MSCHLSGATWHPNSGLQALRLKKRCVSSSLNPEAGCLLVLPESALRSIPSSSDGPSKRRLQIEVRICGGLWHFTRYEWPELLRSFVIRSFKVHLKSWPVMKHGEFVSCQELWGNAPIHGQVGGCKKWIVWLTLRSLSSMLSLTFPVFQIHLKDALYGSMLFLIKRKYWCRPDLLMGAIENLWGVSPTLRLLLNKAWHK